MGSDERDAVIIGAGLGGLACAARLARGGASVLVVEQQPEPGGLAGAFRRAEFTFERSLHLMDAVGVGQPHRALLDELGVTDALELCRPAVLRRELWPEHDLLVPHGTEPWLELMTRSFPREAAGLVDFVRTAERAHAASLSSVEAATAPAASAQQGAWGAEGELARRTAAHVVDAHLGDRRVHAMLDSFSSEWLGLPLTQIGALQFLIPWYSYQAFGGAYPVGGSEALVRALVGQIESAGGEVLLGCGARKIVVEQRRVRGVELASGRWVPTRVVVSNASPQATAHDLLEPGSLEPRYARRLARLEPSVSCVKVWLGLAERRSEVEPTDYDVGLRPSYDAPSDELDTDMRRVSVVRPSCLEPTLAPLGRDVVVVTMVIAPGTWPSASTMSTEVRDEVADTLVERVERALLPGLRAATVLREIATPETFERRAGQFAGSIYGSHARAGRSLGWRLPAETPLHGLWLVGASTRWGAGVTSVLRSGCDVGRTLIGERARRARSTATA
jgi:prolycopene isomerase